MNWFLSSQLSAEPGAIDMARWREIYVEQQLSSERAAVKTWSWNYIAVEHRTVSIHQLGSWLLAVGPQPPLELPQRQVQRQRSLGHGLNHNCKATTSQRLTATATATESHKLAHASIRIAAVSWAGQDIFISHTRFSWKLNWTELNCFPAFLSVQTTLE